MPTFPSGAIERLPWKELRPQVIVGDTRVSGHYAMSPLSRSFQRLRLQWNACEEWERLDTNAEEERVRIRYSRRIETPTIRTVSPKLSQDKWATDRIGCVCAWDEKLAEEIHAQNEPKLSRSEGLQRRAARLESDTMQSSRGEQYTPAQNAESLRGGKDGVLESKDYPHRAIYYEYLQKRIQNL